MTIDQTCQPMARRNASFSRRPRWLRFAQPTETLIGRLFDWLERVILPAYAEIDRRSVPL